LRVYNKTFFAAEAGISPQTLRNAMNGSTPGLHTIRAIAATVGVDWAWLADDERGWPPARVSPIGDLKQESQPNVAAGE
jgi:transcriptional regulator with XRE-family HTH domain